jgi:hypothetical protein
MVELDMRPSEEVQAIKSRLGHPIVDADGHQMEHFPVVLDFVAEIAGPEMKRRWADYGATPSMPQAPGARRIPMSWPSMG